MKKEYFWILTLCFLIFTLMGSFDSFSAQQENIAKVTLRMSWFPTADYSIYVIGVKKGFYLDEGIEVDVVPTKGSPLTVKLIGNREAEFASASAETTLIARTKGMPLKVLAAAHQTSPVSIISLKKAGIKEPKDLEGRSLASDINSMKHTQFQAFCKLNNIDIEKIKLIPIRGSDFVHILRGNADAMLGFGYIADAFLRRKGYQINEIKLSDYGIDIYSLSLTANENLIKENPDLVRRFVKATMRSWNYAVNHPEEVVEAFVQEYEFKKEDVIHQVLGVISLIQSDYTKQHGLGYQSKERWEKTQQLLYEQGLIDKKIDVEKVYTNKFLVN